MKIGNLLYLLNHGSEVGRLEGRDLVKFYYYYISILLHRRRSQRKIKQLPEEKKVEKEEPVREYKVGDETVCIFWGGKHRGGH